MAEWNPWQEMHRLRHDIDRAFAQVGGRNGRGNGHTFPTAFLPGRAARAYPLVNVSEDANALYVTALAPGLDPTAFQLTVQDNRLTMTGEKQRVTAEVQPEAFHRSERAAGTFVRTVMLPSDVEHAQVQAAYKHGLLVVTLPKAEQAKPKQIAVSVAG
jgi:HSP20 family protein